MNPSFAFDELLPPASQFVESDPRTQYWIRDGRIYFGGSPVRQADAASFRFYLGGFAVDAGNCYCNGCRLTGADPTSFRALNYAYYKDDHHVWTVFGEVKRADASSFVVVDDGAIGSYGNWCAFGFGKDTNGVYYIGVHGYMGWLSGVDPNSFVSCGDGHFGFDAVYVYAGNKKLPKARPTSWTRIGGLYSRDENRIYYLNRLIRDADPGSFWVTPEPDRHGQLARDRTRYYFNGTEIEPDEFAAHLGNHS
jgi:DKNYY family